MAGVSGTPISSADFLANLQSGSVYDAAWRGAIVPQSPSTYTAAPTTFSPSYFAGDTDQFFRAISGAPSAPYTPGISEPPSPLWMAGGDLDTMTIDAEITGGSFGVGEPKVDESMGSRMSSAMLLPSGQPDWGKWVIIAGVLVTLYLIGREMGRKGPVQ